MLWSEEDVREKATWIPNPLVRVRVEVDSESYTSTRFTVPRHTQTRNMSALVDSRVQMVVMGPMHAAMLNIKEKEYLPAKITIQVADNRSKKGLSMTIIKITTIGSNRTTRQQAYIMELGNQLYVSPRHFRTSAACRRTTLRRR